MNNEKDSQSKIAFMEKMYFIILVLVIIMIFSAIIIMIIAFVRHCPLPADHISFSLLMSGLAIFLTGTIIIPKFLLERVTNDAVRDFAKETVEKYTKEVFKEHFDSRILEIKTDISKTQNNIDKCDAHLSRMIALGLAKNTPIWSVGWAFRSLKRYRRLNQNDVGLKEYRDFIALINDKVIRNSVRQFRSTVQSVLQDEGIGKISECAWKVLSCEQCNVGNENLNEADRQDSIRISIRTIKDIIDFEYALYIDKNVDASSDAKEEMKHICSSAGYFCRVISAALIYGLPTGTNSNTDTPADRDGVQILLKQICEISDYGDKGKYAKNKEARDAFKKRLEQQFSVIRSSESILSLKDENMWITRTFFN
ncbi:hypothetical protein [uncultured Treponema sp.]|uniref:hypothetical protein n=1 Tax=uncultured Treponema sp. TaxID=162155 RepID=UPI0028050C2C|nr:hypothetical protein [uncultured Treponema sp.]